MTASFVGVGAYNAVAATSGTQTYAWPSGYTPVAGDLAVVMQAGDWVQTNWGLAPYGPDPSGYTQGAKYGVDYNATLTLGLSFHYKFLDGGESAPSVTLSSTYASVLYGFVAIFRGIHYSNLFDIAIKKTSAGSSAYNYLTTSTNTTVSADTLSFHIVSHNTVGALVQTSGSVWTTQAGGSGYDTSVGTDISGGLATRFLSTAGGSIGYVTWTSTNVGNFVGIRATLNSATAPDAPTSVTATPNAVKGFALSWNAPGDNGQLITQYTVDWSTDNSSWTTYGTTATTSLSVTNPGSWANNTLYYFRVKATNSVGGGPYSTSGSGTTWGVPSAPPSIIVGTVTSTTIPLSWGTPASDGGSAITDYVIQYSLNNSSWTTFTDGVSTTSSTVITGLTAQTFYYLRVAAVSDVGTGAYATTTTTTASPPAYWGHVGN